MLQTIRRVACIGAVAGVVGVALFLLVERASDTAASSNSPGFRARYAGRWEEAADPLGAPGDRRVAQGSRWARPGHGQRRDHGEFSPVRGMGGLGVTVAQVGLIAAAVAGLQKRSRRRAAATLVED